VSGAAGPRGDHFPVDVERVDARGGRDVAHKPPGTITCVPYATLIASKRAKARGGGRPGERSRAGGAQ
jgi:hypothetical protein